MAAWTLNNTVRQGPAGTYVRQSFSATATDGATLFREVALIDQGLRKFETPPDQPGKQGMVAYAEAMCVVPAAAGVEAANWVLESSVTTGERIDALWSNTLSVSGKLYLSISFLQEPARVFPAGQPYDGKIRAIHMSMSFAA
jgi:hypothetical protein